MYKIFRLYEKAFKRKYITLRKCKKYNCDYNHAEVCFLKDEIYTDTKLNCMYCEKYMVNKKAVS